MKPHHKFTLSLICIVVLSGCSDGKLTVDKAQKGVDQWAAGNGQVKVSGGIHEIPSENAAKADLTFTNFHYKSWYTNLAGNVEELTWTGPGEATFVHNNDGSWVLKQVRFQGALGPYTYNTNISVP